MHFRSANREARTTVLIPLYSADPFIDQITDNLRKIPQSALVIISDQCQLDGALETLKAIHQNDRRIVFRSVDGPAGWRSHINSVIKNVQTEFFNILAQDDEIDPGYYEALEKALDANPKVGVAFGKVDAIGLNGNPERQRMASPGIPLGVRAPWREALDLDRDWNLGIPYRGLIRAKLLSLVPVTPGDNYADQIWIFSLALISHLIEVPQAIYVKRYHSRNTHTQWRQLTGAERKVALMREVQLRLGNNHPALRELSLPRWHPRVWHQYVCKKSLKKYLRKVIPNFLKPILKRIYYFPGDILYRFKNRDSMVPPKSMIFVGDSNFEDTGQEYIGYFIELANIQPNNRILDVGCGIGRMAIPLTSYLSKEGEYWGFDVVTRGIEWCQKRISSKFSNFHFHLIDVYNKHYNPNGKIRAKDFQFPYGNGFFDFVFLTSVFTHMLPTDLENYLNEISRVLKTGGKCLITFFVLNEEAENLVYLGHSTLDFRHKIEGCSTINKKDPEAAIAYNEESVKRLFEKYGLKIIHPIHYGSWCKRNNFLSYQDIIVAAKENWN